MIKNIFITTAVALLFTACASTSKESKTNNQNLIFEYTCENDKKLEVVYLTIENNDRQARIQLDNAHYILKNIPSGSGAKYSNGKYTWWTKGLTGFLEDDGSIILKDCISQEKDADNK